MVPESVRWLASMGQVEDAESILTRAAKMNGRQLAAPIKLVVPKPGHRRQSMPPLGSRRPSAAVAIHHSLNERLVHTE